MDDKWIILLKDFMLPFLGASSGAMISVYLLKIKKKWSDKYKAFNNAMIQLENLKNTAYLQSLWDTETTSTYLPGDKKSPEHLNEIVFKTMESLISLKLLMPKKFRRLINSYEKKILRHYDTKFWEHEHEGYTYNEAENYYTGLRIYSDHCSRIFISTSALLKILVNKSNKII